MKLKLTNLLIFGLVSLVYFYACFLINRNIFSRSYTPYYNYLIESFGNGKLFIDNPPTTYDLSKINGNLTMYWGITPVFFIYPFFLFGNVATSDVFYTLVAGLVNVILFILLVEEFIYFSKLKIEKFVKYFVILSYVFVSPNFYLSMAGRIWHTNQIISITYLFVFLIFFLKYLNYKKGLYLFLSAVFFTFSWLARNTLIVYGILFFYLFFSSFKKKTMSEFIKQILCAASISAAGLIFFFAYNHIRFGNIFETGISHQLSDPRFSESLHQKKYFSLSYLSDNIRWYFWEPIYLSFKKPYMSFNPEGGSIFLAYPLTFCFVNIASLFRLKKGKKLIILLAIIGLGGTFLLLTFVGSGWTQFGSRYFLDIIPVVYLLSLILLPKLPKILLLGVLVYGIMLNFFGAIYFFKYY